MPSTTRDKTRRRPVEEDTRTLEEITNAYEPTEDVKALLAQHGVRMTPPPERTGSHHVEWAGRAFVIPAEPEPMGLRESAEVLNRKADEEEQEINISEVIDALPWDGAQAFIKAVDDIFGWGILQAEKRQTFFGTIKIPPTMRTIKTGPGARDTMQVFWGELYIPQIDATLQTRATVHEGRVVFQIEGSIQKKNRHKIETLIALARIYANERSIYKGKAFRMFVNEKGVVMSEREPEFIKIDPNIENDLVFSDKVQSQLNTNLFAPIKHPKACRELGIPLKRGILLEGPYGVGKSMTAAATANMAIKHGFTFIMLDRVAGLKAIMDFAHRYAPVVVFAEDIDRIIAGEDRTVSIDDVLNTLDGVQGKSHEIITVLTTNHADRINRALLRPGRLDAIVSIEPPDAAAAERLMRQYSRGLIRAETSLSRAGEAVAGHIPAVIREVVERAKLSAIFREGGVPTELVDDDLVIAADTMKGHLDLMRGERVREKTSAELLATGLQGLVEEEMIPNTKRLEWNEQALRKIAERLSISLD